MTPAVVAARRARIAHTVHEYRHDPDCASYGEEAADKLGLDPRRVFKTLVVDAGDGRLAVGIVPVVAQLGLKAMARALGVKKVAMARPADVERVTGYVLGGVSPLGQKKRLPTVIDASAEGVATVFVSAGRRGLEIELAAADLARLTGAGFAALCAD